MGSIYKKTNELGISTFKITCDGNGCKIVINNHGHIAKAYCGKTNYMALVYSKDDTSESYLENALYEMLLLSQECFWEIVNEIQDPIQLACAKKVITKRSSELKEIAAQASDAASNLDLKLSSIN